MDGVTLPKPTRINAFRLSGHSQAESRADITYQKRCSLVTHLLWKRPVISAPCRITRPSDGARSIRSRAGRIEIVNLHKRDTSRIAFTVHDSRIVSRIERRDNGCLTIIRGRNGGGNNLAGLRTSPVVV